MYSRHPLHLSKQRCSSKPGVRARVAWGPGLGFRHLSDHAIAIKLLRVNRATSTEDQSTGTKDQLLYLSDIIAFQSSTESSDEVGAIASAKADDIIGRATQVLEAARAALSSQSSLPPSETKKFVSGPPARTKPSTNRFSAESVSQIKTQQPDAEDGAAPPRLETIEQGPVSTGAFSADERKRKILRKSLDDVQPVKPMDGNGSSTSSSTSSPVAAPGEQLKTSSWTPDWAQGLISSTQSFGSMSPSLAMDKRAEQTRLAFADPDTLPSMFDLGFQSDDDIEVARNTELPPLQSVLELTGAFRPPSRSGATTLPGTKEGMVTATMALAKNLADGKAVLADGTLFEKLSGEEKGENGYWCRWHLIRGLTADSKVAWEERWYTTSDWFGLKEMGAEKTGTAMDGSSWKESWSEKIYNDAKTLEPVVERRAHKWAHDEVGDEWEEKWNEYYSGKGQVTKSADKWGKQGPNVWHECWGEEYTGDDSCVKWTDKWAERVVEGGGREQWGDKWEERFSYGKGSKTGEVWNADAAGNRYNRWWGEDHYGNGSVRRHGSSTTGEQWDFTEAGDTYYNPIPNFGFKHAISHSPQLAALPVLPNEDPQGRNGGLGLGMDEL